MVVGGDERCRLPASFERRACRLALFRHSLRLHDLQVRVVALDPRHDVPAPQPRRRQPHPLRHGPPDGLHGEL